MMFSKAVITFLAIGALCVNVSATPIPAFWRSPSGKEPTPGEEPTSGEKPTSGEESTSELGNIPKYYSTYGDSDWGPGGKPPSSYKDSILGPKGRLAMYGLGGTVAVAGAVGLAANLIHNKNNETSDDPGYITPPPVSKREPVSEDQASDHLSSPLEREPESDPPSL